ncbi:hypothetical protein H696_00734 [Fonticula alba]|uniref:Uncharacterized protein n=1 Tax=Fonticula alba TaxID=691883 RepID=A0A058ZGU8_FONAL|nr:hypothetical protein H696_00734 [Fonticula alba]KCV73191.1 hypothetical protein H696_00734 [Fonticula alba]|eukprot:XP_009492892.1 hypothetical protein H696_00734 [Fonticula alba]
MRFLSILLLGLLLSLSAEGGRSESPPVPPAASGLPTSTGLQADLSDGPVELAFGKLSIIGAIPFHSHLNQLPFSLDDPAPGISLFTSPHGGRYFCRSAGPSPDQLVSTRISGKMAQGRTPAVRFRDIRRALVTDCLQRAPPAGGWWYFSVCLRGRITQYHDTRVPVAADGTPLPGVGTPGADVWQVTGHIFRRALARVASLFGADPSLADPAARAHPPAGPAAGTGPGAPAQSSPPQPVTYTISRTDEYVLGSAPDPFRQGDDSHFVPVRWPFSPDAHLAIRFRRGHSCDLTNEPRETYLRLACPHAILQTVADLEASGMTFQNALALAVQTSPDGPRLVSVHEPMACRYVATITAPGLCLLANGALPPGPAPFRTRAIDCTAVVDWTDPTPNITPVTRAEAALGAQPAEDPATQEDPLYLALAQSSGWQPFTPFYDDAAFFPDLAFNSPDLPEEHPAPGAPPANAATNAPGWVPLENLAADSAVPPAAMADGSPAMMDRLLEDFSMLERTFEKLAADMRPPGDDGQASMPNPLGGAALDRHAIRTLLAEDLTDEELDALQNIIDTLFPGDLGGHRDRGMLPSPQAPSPSPSGAESEDAPDESPESAHPASRQEL